MLLCSSPGHARALRPHELKPTCFVPNFHVTLSSFFESCDPQHSWIHGLPSSSSGMSKSRRRNSSGELDVFEAALYYSAEVHEANLIGIQRAVAERRSSVDTPGREATELFQRLAKSDWQSKNKGERQPCPGAKLASSIRSFFNQVISKKAASEYLEKQAKRSSREPTPSLSQREALQDGRSAKSTHVYCDDERCMVNARAALPGEALIAKAGEWRGRTEEEDGGGSDSSSDLFELES